MGIFDFVKSVGEAITGSAKAATAAVASHAAPVASAAPAAAAIKDHIVNLGLDMKDFEVKVEGDKVILGGSAANDEVREKVILAAGNTLGVGQVQEEIKVASSGPASVFYTVKKGDTLSKIAEHEYGKGKGGKYTLIFDANKPMLKHPDKIYPGQVLRIPPLEGKAAA